MELNVHGLSLQYQSDHGCQRLTLLGTDQACGCLGQLVPFLVLPAPGQGNSPSCHNQEGSSHNPTS